MSRVDDDRDAARLAERLALQKRQEEAKAKSRQGESAFAKLIQQGRQPAPARSSALPGEVQTAKSDQPAPPPRSFAGKLAKAPERGGEPPAPAPGQPNPQLATEGRQQDHRLNRGRAESRREDARVTEKRLDERGGDDESTALGEVGAHSGRSKGELKTDVDSGGGGGGNKKDEKGGGELAAGFRFNPALMAPVPVAKPKDTAGSARLRAIANEIAQKIVERVRVGTNAAGHAEMQIELRSNVLSGLNIQITAHNGKIRASFSGTNKEVLALLKEQGEVLKQTLEGRGLRLEEFKVEARA